MKDTPIERLKELLAELSLPLLVECSIYEPMAASIVPADFSAGGNTIAHLPDYQNAVALTEIVNALPALLATIEPIPSAGEGERLREALEDLKSEIDGIYHYTFEPGTTGFIRREALAAGAKIDAALATLPSEPLRVSQEETEGRSSG
jgi:hypothetical protein